MYRQCRAQVVHELCIVLVLVVFTMDPDLRKQHAYKCPDCHSQDIVEGMSTQYAVYIQIMPPVMPYVASVAL